MSETNGNEKNTSYGVFVQACWAQHTRQYPDHLIHKEIEEFNKQCSVWWYNLSEQERERFQEVADRSNAQQPAPGQGYAVQDNHTAKQPAPSQGYAVQDISSSADFQNGTNGKMQHGVRDMHGVSTTTLQNGAGLHQNGVLDQGGDGIQSYLNSFSYGDYGGQGEAENVNYAVNGMASGGQQLQGGQQVQGIHSGQTQQRMQPANTAPQRPVQKAMKDPNAPKKPLSAYFLFSQDERVKVKAENPDYSITDVAKELGRRWATINPALKQQYEHKYQAAKTIYDRENGSTKPQKKKKDPNAPKQPLSAYFLFSAEERLKIKDDNPNISICDVAKELGRRWAELNPATKQKFQALAEEGRQKYDVDMAAYRKGTFQHPETQASINNRQAEYQQAQIRTTNENKPMADNRQQRFEQTNSVISVDGRQQGASQLTINGLQSQAASDLSLGNVISMDNRQPISLENRQQTISAIPLDPQQTLETQRRASTISLDHQQISSTISLGSRHEEASPITLDSRQQSIALGIKHASSVPTVETQPPGGGPVADSVNSLAQHSPVEHVLDMRAYTQEGPFQQTDGAVDLASYGSETDGAVDLGAYASETYQQLPSSNGSDQHSPPNHPSPSPNTYKDQQYLSTNGLPQNDLPPNGLNSNDLPTNGLPANGLPENEHPSNGIPTDYSSLIE